MNRILVKGVRAFVISAFLVLTTALHAQQIIYVNQNAPTASLRNGTSWSNAFMDLQSGIAAAHPTSNAPVSIFVAAGTYKPTTGTDQTVSFVLKSYLNILGGFAGTETNVNQRAAYGHATVLSGDIGVPVSHPLDQNNIETATVAFNPNDPGLQDNSYNVLYGSNVTGVVLDQLYITGGYANVSASVIDPTELLSMAISTGPTNTGQGFLGPTILPLDSRVAGGGLCLINPASASPPTGTSLNLISCCFVDNGARGYGGGLAAKYALVEAAYSIFVNNYAGREGGGYWDMNCLSDFDYCNFVTNVCAGNGGALVHQSMPTDYTVDPFYEQDESYRQTLENIVNANIADAKFSTLLYDESGVDNDFFSRLLDLVPGAPFEIDPYEAIPTNQPLAIESRLSRSVNWATAAFASVDVAADIVSTSSQSSSALVQNWTQFRNNYNSYSTPLGFIYQLYEAGDVTDGDGFTDSSYDVKFQENGVYNMAPYSTVVGCQFLGNSAGDEAGAYLCFYDNVQVEDCLFQGNTAQDAGAMANFDWTTPIIISCAFYDNTATAGNSAVVNAFHARAQMMSCTYSYNLSTTVGSAMANELAADVVLCNSIFWDNSNMLNFNYVSGSDLFTSVHTNLDAASLSNYNLGLNGGTYVDWVAVCDVSWSCVQSLEQLPLGVDEFRLTFPPGFTLPNSLNNYNFMNNYIATWNMNLFSNDLAGLLDTLDYFNTGEGFRTNILDPRKGNISDDPLLINGIVPSRFAPTVNAGNSTRLNNGIINSLTDWDAQLAPRFYGASIDMGAVEYNGGPDPDPLPGYPPPSRLEPNVIYVTPSGSGTQDGTSWTNATANLGQAMTNVNFIVWAAQGTYYPTTTSDRTASFSLGTNVQVYGGFQGTETNLNQRNWKLYPTILSGDIGVRGNDSDNSFHVMAMTNIDALSILDGLTITKGHGTNGAGIYNINSHPFITNCAFVDNQATGLGGAIYSSGVQGSPINQSIFVSNSAAGAGGAIYMNSRTFIENCSFIRNTSLLGGAICYSNASYDYIYNSLFASNGVVGGSNAAGGAIESQQTGLTIFNCTFAMNYDAVAGTASAVGAAGLDFQSSISDRLLYIENSIFWKNIVTNALGSVGLDEQQQITTNSSNPYFITDTLIEGLQQFAGSSTSGNIDVDPLFANVAAGDFSLLPYSPAIDAGNAAGQSLIVPVDLAGNPRLANASIDLGAYEYQGVPIKLSFQISVTRSCDETGASYSLQLLPSSATNVPLTGFQWQVNKNDGQGFAPITDGGVYAGTLTSNLMITQPSVSMNGYRYIVQVSSSNLQFTSESDTIFVAPSRFYVNASATGANTGLTWTDAFTDLQSALAAAQPCSQIWVAAGTYYPSAAQDVTAAYAMRTDIGIYGGFAGTETNLAQRNWIANPTILSGQLGSLGQTNLNSLSIFFNYGNQVGFDCGPTAVLDGFTLLGAQDSAVVNFYASPTIRNCVFTNNTGGYGGAMRNFFSASPLIVDCTFVNNSSPSGGAIDCSQGANATFINCLFANNTSSFEGGALNVSLSDVHLINCTVADNFAVIAGGGLYGQSATVEVLNSILWGNMDQEPQPSATSPQAYLDTGAFLNMTNSCLQGFTNTANGNVGFDPLFAGSALGNFRLTSNSPAIDAGSNIFAAGYYTDLDGNNRIVNKSVDMGAYEYPLLGGTPVQLLAVPSAASACNAAGAAVFSITGTNGGAASFIWQVNKNDGQGFVPVVTNASASVLLSNGTSTLVISNISLSMNGSLYAAAVGSSGFITPPVVLMVEPPKIIFVNDQLHEGANNGTAWASAFTNLQQAINSAPSCSQIWVAQGTYTPMLDSLGYSSFRLVSGVGIYGGFAGTETLLSQRNWTNHPVVVTGGVGVFALFDNTAQSAPIDASAVLDGFVLAPSNGFAINNYQASPTIQNCVVTGSAQFGIFSRNGSPVISACVFSNNTGLSIYNQDSSPSIGQCLFIGNQTGSSGGAIYNSQASPVITDCLFTNNSAAFGGAIYNDNLSLPWIDRCQFLDNASTGGGGAIYDEITAAPTIKNSVFDQNVSQFQGGAIADYGDGLTLAFCTLARNSAAYSGAGLYFQGSAAAVDSCIFWGNAALQNPGSTSVEKFQVDNETASLAISNSIVQGLSTLTGPNNIPYDPLFTNLARGDFHLTAYSPALNAGDAAAALNEATDVTGQPRIFSSAPDLGAYEYQSAPAGKLAILGLPQSLTKCALTPVEFDIVTQIGDTNVFQWQVLSGSTFVSIPNVPPYTLASAGNINSLLIPSVSPSMNGMVFRFVSLASGYISPPFTLTVTAPSVIYVNASAATPGNGSSWTAPLTNLQTAFLEGNPCSQIWVARGTYVPTQAPDGNPSLVMQSGLRVYGGFAGFETNLAQRNWTTNPTILMAQTSAAVIENIGTTQTIDASATLDGFIIDGRNYAGNAIFNDNASPTFQNCLFVNGSPAMWNAGGANPVLLSCVFSNNDGQAMVNQQSAPLLSNCLFVANSGSNLVGGALYNYNASPTIFACQFISNSAVEGAALAFDGNSSGIIRRSFFQGNVSTSAGAVFCANSTALLADDVFAGNSADQGGAVFVDNAILTLNNSTLTGNSASYQGGGVFNFEGTLAATNTIFWNNEDSTGLGEFAQINNQGGAVAVAHSIITSLSTYAGNQNIAFDPLFQAPLANDFTPSASSPAINAGLNSAVATGDLDFNGNLRIVQTTVDLGAVEVQNPTSATPVDLSAKPSAQTTCPGGTAVFTVTGSANSGGQFTWQVNEGGGFEAIPGDGFQFVTSNNNSATVTISNTPANYNYSYRFLINSSGYTSPSYTLSVLPPRIIYVNANATGNDTGVDWANAFTNFAVALTNGDTCSQVWVAAGNYAPVAGQPAQMKSGLAIYGGFTGTETNLSQRNWTNHPTVLSANATASAIFNQGNFTPIGRTAVLDGFFLTGTGSQPAIENLQASPTIRNCIFQSNFFTALQNINASPWIDTCVFSNNNDGAINIEGGAPTITNCTFTGNQTTISGAAIYSTSGAQTAILGCWFNGNNAGGDGGAVASDGATLAVVDSIFAGNSTGGVGGAAANLGSGAAFFTNSVVYGGNAFGSGAIYNSAALTLVNCTIAGNLTASEGGGVSTFAGTVTLLNTILWQNSTVLAPPSLESEQIYNNSGSVAATNSLIQGLAVYAGFNNIGNDPLFLNPASGNYQISPSSPAINVGLNSFNTLSLDAAGQPRVQYGVIDLGAYESASIQSNSIQLVGSPVSQNICAGRTAAFTVQSQKSENFTWQYFDGTNWDDFTYNAGLGAWTGPALGGYQITTNATSSTLTLGTVTLGMNGYQFRFLVAGGYTGSTLVLTVTPASVIYVNAAAGLGGNGESWGSAFGDLQTALASVSGCQNEIWLAAGSYSPGTGTNASATFSLPAGAALYGGFSGTETNRAQRNWQSHPTLLNSLNGQYIVNIDGSVTPIGAETVLDGFTLQGAATSGLEIINSSPTVQNCTFQNNNQGVLLLNSSPTLAQCSFLSNNGSEGGGLQAFSGNVSLLDCLFSNNTASASGGGIYAQSGNLNLTNCLLTGNSAPYGGGVYAAEAGAINIVNCTVAGNAAASGGAGLQGSENNLFIANSIFWNNTVNGTSNELAQIAATYGQVSISYTCLEGLSNYVGNQNIGYDPLFENAAEGQYTLQLCSPALNAGDNADIANVTTDLAGSNRLAGSAVDLGAYEIQGAASASLAIQSQPVSFAFCAGNSNSISVSAFGAGLSYQWQADDHDGRGFVLLTDGGMFSGSTSSNLTVNSASSTNSGMSFRCVISSSAGCSLISSTATMTYPFGRWYVNASGFGGNGSSWPQAFKTLDQALAASFQTCNNEIWVAAGVYVPPANGYAMTNNVALYGGFSGVETNLNQRNWTNYPAIIDGQHTVVYLIQNISTCMPLNSSARLDGFTLQNAAACAMTNYAAQEPTIANCVFRANPLSAISDYNATPFLTNCIFLQNGSSANQGGGAINHYAAGDSMLIENCIFQGNVTGNVGAAVSDQFGIMTFVNCLFSGNYAAYGGAGIVAGGEGGFVTLRNCTFSGNEAGLPPVAVDLGVPCFVYNSIFWNNYTPYGSGAAQTNEDAQIAIFNDGTPRVCNSCIEGLVVSGGQFSGEGNIGSDPQFVQNIDPSAAPVLGGNFHLFSCSPAEDAGTNSQVGLAIDLDGNPRIQNGEVAMGVYEDAVPPAFFTAQPQNQSANVSNTVQFTVTAFGSNLVYQWQVSMPGGHGFVNVTNTAPYSGAATPILTISNVTSALDGAQYRCEFSDQCSVVPSSPAMFHFLYYPPVASNISASNYESFAVLGNLQGADPQGLPLTYKIVTQPAQGSVFLNSNNFEYVASNQHFYDNDGFTYEALDPYTNSTSATVFISFIKVEQNPTANNLNIIALENTPTNFTLTGSDVNGDPLTFFIAVPPQHGALNLIGSNAFYMPATNYSGADYFIYQSSNGVYASGAATVSISVNRENRPPVTMPDSATIYSGQTVSISVLQNDIDLDDNPLSIVGVTQGTNGSVAFTTNRVTYTHNGSNTTNDSFIYTVADGQGNDVPGVVTITILQPGTSSLVTTNADSGPGSLRAAIAGANTVTSVPYQIVFSPALAGQTIALSNVDDNSFGPSSFVLSNHIIIDATNAPGLILARSTTTAPMRFFHVIPGATLALRNIILTNGYALGTNGGDGVNGEGCGGGAAGLGGAIYSEGSLSLSGVFLTGNHATGGNGGVSVAGISTSPGIGGGVNGGIGAGSPGGFGGGGAGAAAGTQTPGGAGGFGGGLGGGSGSTNSGGGAGGLGGGGGSGGGSYFSGGGGAGLGGAVFNHGGTFAATNCLFAGNSVSGGATGSAPSSVYQGNPGEGLGGGVVNYNGTAVLSSCVFGNNSADLCDGLLNLGDGTSAMATLLQTSFTNLTGLTNFMQIVLHGGTANGIRDNLSNFGQNPPFLQTISNQTTAGPLTFSFAVSTPVSSPFVVSAASSAPSLIPDANLTLGGSATIRSLSLLPVFGASGLDNVTIQVADGSLTMSEIVPVNVTRNLTVFAPLGGAVTIPLLTVASGWTVTSVGQAASGTVNYYPTSITYSNSGEFTTSDSFNYQLSSGGSNAAGTVSISILTNVVPYASSQFVSTFTNTPTPITLFGSDVFNDPVTYTVDVLPQHGVLSGLPPALLYTPAINYTGPDSFAFHVNNRFSNSPSATVSIAVREILGVAISSAADSGAGSLRAALAQANADNFNLWHITFGAGLAHSSILLSNIADNAFGPSALVVSNLLILDGGASGMSLARSSVAGPVRLFHVAPNAQLTLLNMVLTNGQAAGGNGANGAGGGGGGAGLGGAIFNEGALIISNSVLSQNQAFGGNGGLYNTDGQPDGSTPGGIGGGVNGGLGLANAAGGAGGFGGGGAGGGTPNSGFDSGGAAGFGGIAGGSYPVAPFALSGGAGGFGAGGGGGWLCGGGGGAGMGGAIFNDGGSVTLTASVFSNNAVSGGSSYIFNNAPGAGASGLGGAVFNYNGLLTISNSVLTGNSGANGGAVYNMGNAATSQLVLQNVSMTNNAPFDFVQNQINAGFAATSAHGDVITQGSPWLQDLADHASSGPVTLPLVVSAPLTSLSNRLVTVSSDNPPFLGSTNFLLTVSNASGSLAILPPEAPGSANVTLTLTDGNLSYSDTFKFTLSYNLSASVQAGLSATLMVLPTNSALSIISAGQGANGTVTFSANALTYQETGAGTNDYFTYTLSDGTHNFQGSVSVTIQQTTLQVTSTADGGPGSLRAAIALANASPQTAWRVALSSALAGQTILLNTVGDTSFGPSGLAIAGNVTIDGVAAPGAILSRNTNGSTMRLMLVAPGATLQLNNLKLQNGLAQGGAGGAGQSSGGGGAGLGGAILNAGNMTVSNIVFAQNGAIGGTGGTFDTTPDAGDGGGPLGGLGGLPTGDGEMEGGFSSGGGGGQITNELGNGASGGFGGGNGGGSSGVNYGGSGGFGGGGGAGLGGGGGGGLGAGGAIFSGGTTALIQCSFSGNFALAGMAGAGYMSPSMDGTPGNALGGAVFNYNGSLSISNSMFSGSSSSNGGGLYVLADGSSTQITLTGVTATDPQGGADFVSMVLAGGSLQILESSNNFSSQAAPYLGPIANVTTNRAFSVALAASTPTTNGSYNIMALSSNPTLLANSNLVVTGTGSQAVLAATPTAGQTGTALVTVIVTDTGISVATSFQVTIVSGGLVILSENVQGLDAFHLHFQGTANTNYSVQASTNLINWMSLGLASQATPGLYDFVDSNSAAFKSRFYRLEQVTLAPISLLQGKIGTNSPFQLRFTGAGNSYTVLASTNLMTWTPLGPATASGSNTWLFLDPEKHPARYYWIRSP